MKYYYHATPMSNFTSILRDGLKPGCDKMVYMCETPKDAAKFVAIRGVTEILVCKIKVFKKDEKFVQETFDHSMTLFQCRAFGYMGPIKRDKIVEFSKYSL